MTAGSIIVRDVHTPLPPIAVLNTTILTADGEYRLETVSLEQARHRVQHAESVTSAVGHEGTAQIMTSLLGVDVPVNRIQYEQAPGAEALCFKLRGRAPEGVILTAGQVEEIGYDFKLLTRVR